MRHSHQLHLAGPCVTLKRLNVHISRQAAGCCCLFTWRFCRALAKAEPMAPVLACWLVQAAPLRHQQASSLVGNRWSMLYKRIEAHCKQGSFSSIVDKLQSSLPQRHCSTVVDLAASLEAAVLLRVLGPEPPEFPWPTMLPAKEEWMPGMIRKKCGENGKY